MMVIHHCHKILFHATPGVLSRNIGEGAVASTLQHETGTAASTGEQQPEEDGELVETVADDISQHDRRHDVLITSIRSAT